jgi:hypothetical protein
MIFELLRTGCVLSLLEEWNRTSEHPSHCSEEFFRLFLCCVVRAADKVRFIISFSLGKFVSLTFRSVEQFPKCNGAHVAFNKESGDNVGPLLIK